jgi:hypothetical protein
MGEKVCSPAAQASLTNAPINSPYTKPDWPGGDLMAAQNQHFWDKL